MTESRLFDLDAERWILAYMLASPAQTREIADLLPRGAFMHPKYRIVANVLSRHKDDAEFLPVVIGQEMLDQGAAQIDKQTLNEFLSDLSCATVNSATMQHFVSILKSKAVQRQAVAAAEETVKRLSEANGDLPAVLRETTSAMIDLVGKVDHPDDGRLRPNPTDAIADLEHALPLRDPVVDGLIRRGEVGNFVSGSKFRKSHTVMDLALHVTTGRSWLSFPTVKNRVLMMDFELYAGDWQHRLDAISRFRGITPDQIAGLDVEYFRGRQGIHIYTLAEYFAAIPRDYYGLIIIDALYKIFPPDMDENSNVHMAAIYTALLNYAEQLNSAILCVHHATKGNQAEKSITEMGAGAGSQSRAADAHFGMREHAENDCAVFEGVVRSFRPPPVIALRWHWPVWEVADDLDPDDLKRVGQRGRPKKEDTTEARIVKARTTPREFIEKKYIRAEPQSEAAIIFAAAPEGYSGREVKLLIKLALEEGLIHRWIFRDHGKIEPTRYSTEPQTLLDQEKP